MLVLDLESIEYPQHINAPDFNTSAVTVENVYFICHKTLN